LRVTRMMLYADFMGNDSDGEPAADTLADRRLYYACERDTVVAPTMCHTLA
jgi:hypothetical protein